MLQVHSAISNQPFLKWAGSKRNLLNTLLRFWPGEPSRYVEPFAGSACLFFAIGPERAALNDINGHLIRTYGAIKKDPEKVLYLYRLIPRSKEHYYSIRRDALLADDDFALAANFLYLNRNCFNGLFRTNKAGEFNVPFSNNRTGELNEIRFLKSAKALSSTTLHSTDFELFINDTVRTGDFVYIDPPYALKNQRIFTQYGPDSFGTQDLERLAVAVDLVHDRGARFVVSYADCEEVRMKFDKWALYETTAQRNISGFAASRKRSKELMFTNIIG